MHPCGAMVSPIYGKIQIKIPQIPTRWFSSTHLNAWRAAWTAMSMSSLPAACTSAMVCSVLGLMVAKVLPDLLLCHSLLMKSCNRCERIRKLMKNVSAQKVQQHIAGYGCQRFIIFADNVKPPFPYLISTANVTQQGTRHRTIIHTHTHLFICMCACLFVYSYSIANRHLISLFLFLYASQFSKFIICLKAISEWLSRFWKIIKKISIRHTPSMLKVIEGTCEACLASV